MIQEGTELQVIDNTGVSVARCIKIITGSGRVGDIIVVVAAKVGIESKIKAGDIVRALIVRTKLPIKGLKLGEMTERFEENSVVLIKQTPTEIVPIGTRIRGPIAEFIRHKKELFKIVSVVV